MQYCNAQFFKMASEGTPETSSPLNVHQAVNDVQHGRQQ
jgi:hypothetical protein